MAYKLDKDAYQHLSSAVEYSRRKRLFRREKRLELIRAMVGKHYSEQGSSVRVPMPLLEMAFNIYLRYLAAQAPRAMVTSDFTELRPTADEFELRINKAAEEVEYAYAQRMAVADAMFDMGILKVGITASGRYARIDNEDYATEQLFVDHVSPDDWVDDRTAKNLKQAAFMGNRYWACYEDVKDDPRFNKEALKQIEPTLPGDNRDGEEREEELSTGRQTTGDEERFEDRVELIDLWLPRHKTIITCDAELKVWPPLESREWTGPPSGPYHLLGFEDVPGQLDPLAPASVMADVHDLANRLMRKLGNQAERQKTLLGYRGTAANDAQRVVEANDGEALLMDNPEGTREFTFGGPDQRNLAFTLMLKDLFSYQSGNLDLLGGLGAQSPTAKQDEMLQGSASKRMEDMQGRVTAWASQVYAAMGYYLWTEPFPNVQLVKRHQSGLVTVPFRWTASRRKGQFQDYGISIHPYSFTAQTPTSKLQAVMQYWERVVMPYVAQYQQAGAQPNVRAMSRIVAKLMQVPEVEELLLMYGMPAQQEQQGMGPSHERTMAPVTHRTNERVNRSEVTRQGKERDMMSMLLGKDLSPNRAA